MPLLYRLFEPDGTDIGDIQLQATSWRPDDVIYRAPGDSLRIVDVVDRDEDGVPLDETGPYVAFLFVEPIAEA